MKKVLVVETSPRGEHSVSRKLTAAVVARISKAHADAQITRRDLAAAPLPHLGPAHLNAFMAKPPEYTEDDRRAVQDSNAVTQELLQADIIVVGTPMWNFTIPSVLKSWIDHAVRAGVTFRYGDKGPEGLLRNKKLYVALSSGGIYGSGAGKSHDFIEPYLRAVFGFMGVADFSFVRAEGMSMASHAKEALDKGIASIHVD